MLFSSDGRQNKEKNDAQVEEVVLRMLYCPMDTKKGNFHTPKGCQFSHLP